MTSWQQDPFFQYPRTPVTTSAGQVEMPILYFDNSQWMCLFWADLAAAKTLVAQGLEVLSFGGKALVGVAFYEYRGSSIGAYNEVGVAIACVPKGVAAPRWPLLSLLRHPDHNVVGLYIIDLPVTTVAACAAGREIWNYPKFVTPISYQMQGKHFSGAVQHPEGGADILRLSGKAGLGLPYNVIDLVLYSTHQGQRLRTNVNTRGRAQAALGGSVRLRLSATEHPMAQRLAKLGLDGKKPFAVIYTDKLQLRLNSGAALDA